MVTDMVLRLGDFRADGGGPMAGADVASHLKIGWDSSITVEVVNPYSVNLISFAVPDEAPARHDSCSAAVTGRTGAARRRSLQADTP